MKAAIDPIAIRGALGRKLIRSRGPQRDRHRCSGCNDRRRLDVSPDGRKDRCREFIMLLNRLAAVPLLVAAKVHHR